jgi:hypothetical protein
MNMKSRPVRKFAYCAALAVSMFAAQPTPAAAEDVHGSFTLSHIVHCQKAVLRPGNYSFSIKAIGSSQVLILRGLNGTGTDAMLVVHDIESPKPQETSSLVLVSRGGESFLSAMALPNYYMTLRFAVPKEKASHAGLVETASN